MKEILIPLNLTTTPTVYDTKQSFSSSDDASGVLTFSTTADVSGTVASLTIRNASKNANRQTVRIERLDVNTSPFSYMFKNQLPFGQYEGTILLKKNLTVIASAVFLFGVNSSLAAEVLPDLVKAYSLDELVEQVETEVSNLKDAFNVTVSETVKGVNKTESSLQAQENVRYLNEATRKANELERIANENARVAAELERKNTFDTLVDSEVIEQTVMQEVAEKYQEIEATQANRLLSAEQQLAKVELEKATKVELAAVASGSPKGAFATLAALQSAYPTGNTNIYVVTADGDWYYWSGSAWTSGGLYQSTGVAPWGITTQKVADTTITGNKTDFFVKSTNMHNDSAAIPLYQIHSQTGLPYANTQYNAADWVEVKPSDKLTMIKIVRLAFYDIDKKFLSISDAPLNNLYTVTIPANCYYIRYHYFHDQGHVVQLNKGETLLTYEGYYSYVPLSKIEPLVTEYYNRSVYFAPESLPRVFNSPETALIDSILTVANLYAKYDALVTAYPNYITKTLLGKDASGVHDVYKYEFKPEELSRPSGTKVMPKIIITSGMHGFETLSINALCWFMEDICTDWQTNEALEYLRHNIHFVIMPLVNPWSYANQTRVNANSVDINVNFDYNWDTYVSQNVKDPIRSTYKGSAPFSEVETQYLRNLLYANKDAVAYVDYHTNAGSLDTYTNLMWHMTNHEDVQLLAKNHIGKMTRKWQKEYPALVDQTKKYAGYVSSSISPNHLNYAHRTCKILTSVTENWFRTPNMTTAQNNHINYEFFATWVFDLINYLNKKL